MIRQSLAVIAALVGIQFSPCFSNLSYADSSSSSQPDQYVLCRLQKNVRTIRIEKSDAGVCRTMYTKSGLDSLIGEGRNFNSCKEYLASVRGNLEKAAWKCRDISKTAVSTPAGAE
jgi:hypothetical protein